MKDDIKKPGSTAYYMIIGSVFIMLFRLLIVLIIMFSAGVALINIIVTSGIKGNILDVNYAISQGKSELISKKNHTAIVFGASVLKNQEPSPMYKDRLDVAVTLYNAGLIKDILVTGDGTCSSYNETTVGKKYLVNKKVPVSVIKLDENGIDTYNSLYSASKKYGDNLSSSILVSQAFHLKRALYIAESLGYSPLAISPDQEKESQLWWGPFREVFARVKAYFDVHSRSFAKISLKLQGLNDCK